MALPLITAFALLTLTLLLLYKYLVYPALLSPLSAIPAAHWSARFSPLWIWHTRFHSLNNTTTLAAHRRLGPLVLLGPNELSIACVDAGIRTVYGAGFEKHAWYPRLFPSYGVLNMFSMLGHGEHAARKRLLSNVYSKSSVQSSAQVAANSVSLLYGRFLPAIDGFAERKESVEVHALNNAFTMDFMSAFQFGLASGTDFTRDVRSRTKILHEYHCRKEFEFYHQEVPLLRDVSRWLGWPLVPRYCDTANQFFEDWNMGMCDGAERALVRDAEKGTSGVGGGFANSPGDDPIVYRHFKTGLARANEQQNGKSSTPSSKQSPWSPTRQRLEVASEMLDHLGAGHETSAIALTYLYHELSLRPALQKKLRDECLGLSVPILWPTAAGEGDAAERRMRLPDPKEIDALPLLHAVVMETLRLHAPIPGMEPRVTPRECPVLAGYEGVPEGVRISAMPFVLHREEGVFPRPEEWEVGRWLCDEEGDGEDGREKRQEDHKAKIKEMMRWFWAFGSGGRMCIGSHLALQEIKLIVCAIYSNYATEIVNDDGIEEIDAYTTRPRRNALDLRFVRVKA